MAWWRWRPRGPPPAVVREFLKLGAGLGTVLVCSETGAAGADVGCAINCAYHPITYKKGVRVFWLNIPYHGEIDGLTWADRVMGAMRVAMETLLKGQDVALHCIHGPRWKKNMSVVWDASTISKQKLGTDPRSQVHEGSA